MTVSDPLRLPNSVLGGAWKVQKERMDAGIFFPLFLVLVGKGQYSIQYLSADLQTTEMFVERAPLSASARRAGWQGFVYDLAAHKDAFVCLSAGRSKALPVAD